MVRTSESSQCRAVAVPCAWKARRSGCEVDSRGGSVVALIGYRIYQIMQRRVPFFRACPELEGKEPQLRREVCDALDVESDGQERGVRSGGSFICRGQARAEEQHEEGASRLARKGRCRWAMAQVHSRRRVRSSDGFEVHSSSVRGVQETGNLWFAPRQRGRSGSRNHPRYPSVTRLMHTRQ